MLRPKSTSRGNAQIRLGFLQPITVARDLIRDREEMGGTLDAPEEAESTCPFGGEMLKIGAKGGGV